MCEVVKEIHDIREKNYEATKNMPFHEMKAYYKKGANKVKKEIEAKRKELINT
ncbi:MAG: hypothetical protein FWC68_02705 [Oscillospiraceae bacterium]|nr:hypothetical protein [Oscillospiraceae bacterium]